ncbi:hypothetical protein ACX6XY_07290 [Streptomyces sp. O3]
MSIAMLAQAGPGFRMFGGALAQVNRRLAADRRGIAAAARAAGGLRGASAQAQREMRKLGPASQPSGQALLGLGRKSAAARPQVDRGRLKFKAANREIKRLKRQSTTAALLVKVNGKGAGTTTKLSKVFGRVSKLGAGVMKLVNTVMKANPWGLVLGLITPLIAYLVDLAVQSKTGQKIIQTVTAVTMKTVQTIAKVIMPVVTAVAKIAIAYVQGYLKVISTVVKWIVRMVRDPMAAIQRLVGSFGGALRRTADSVFGGVKRVVTGALDWLTSKPRQMFQDVLGAMRSSLGAIGDFITTGLQMVMNVMKAPLNGLIGFANWVIDGLNSLSFSILGKKFGVDIDKIPLLAEGGVVRPRRGGVPAVLAEAGEAEAVFPLPDLQRLMDTTARHAAATRAAGGYLEHYTEPAERGAHGVAEDLLFLARVGGPADPTDPAGVPGVPGASGVPGVATGAVR